MSTWPTAEQIQAVLDGPADQPVVMLNLLEFKERATGEYEGLTGREAVLMYSRAMREFVEGHGGTFLLAANVDSQLIGEGGERFGFVGIMRYPSRQAYLALAGDPEIAATIGKHREAGLENQWLFAMSELSE